MRWPWSRPKTLGAQGERIAERALHRAGYRILDRNVELGRYEIDLIAQEDDTVAFVEVKTRRSDDLANPEDNVTFGKQQHIVRAAKIWIARHGSRDINYRFDVVSVVVPESGKPDVTIYRDAFRA